jgi:hypothetical protein
MSNLLSQASLVMIPSGYKEDIVFSAIPSDGSGDLSFTRASNGTRVNSAGLVEVCPWNLLTYSEEFNNAAWTKDASTISSNAINAPNGTLTADLLIPSTTSATDHRIRQSLPNSVGNFNYSVYVKSGGYNWVKLRSEANWANVNLSNGAIGFTSGVTPTVEILSDGWYRISFSVVNVSGGFAYVYPMNVNENSIDPSAWAGNGTSGVYLWGAQLNIGSTAKPYFPTTDRLNVPRLTYQNGGGGCPSLLLEPQRTNLALYSEEFNNAYWATLNTTVSANSTATLDPMGGNNADKFIATTTNGVHILSRSGFTSGAYSFTVYAKAAEESTMSLWLRNASVGATFDLSNGTVSSITVTSASITSVGNGWYRCFVYDSTAGTTAHIYGRGGTSYAGNGVDGFYIFGAQLEAGAYPTTYIPTTSASATRVADACFKTGISSLIGQTEGTLYWEGFLGANNQTVFSVRASNAQNSCVIDIIQNNRINAYVVTNNVPRFSLNSDVMTLGANIKIAFAYKSGESVLYVNGVSVTSSTAFTFAEGLEALFADWNGYNYGSANVGTKAINQALLFKTRLSNTELAQITTL